MKSKNVGVCPATNLLFLTLEGHPCQKRLAVLLGMLKPEHQIFMNVQLMNCIYLGEPPVKMSEGMSAVYDLAWEIVHDCCVDLDDTDPLVRSIHDKWVNYTAMRRKGAEA